MTFPLLDGEKFSNALATSTTKPMVPCPCPMLHAKSMQCYPVKQSINRYAVKYVPSEKRDLINRARSSEKYTNPFVLILHLGRAILDRTHRSFLRASASSGFLRKGNSVRLFTRRKTILIAVVAVNLAYY